MVADIEIAFQRLQKVADGATWQDAYSRDDQYAAIGEKIRADLRAVLQRVKARD